MDDFPKITEEQQKLLQEDYEHVHRVFFQNEDGKRLLEKWIKEYVMTPTVIPGNSLEAHGIREGSASFVRAIMEKIDIVNNHQPSGE